VQQPAQRPGCTRAFSGYLFSPTGQLLLTRRAKLKHTFPGPVDQPRLRAPPQLHLGSVIETYITDLT